MLECRVQEKRGGVPALRNAHSSRMAITAPPGLAWPGGEIEYPASDGKPMAETDRHRALMIYAIDALVACCADHEAEGRARADAEITRLRAELEVLRRHAG